MRQTKLAKYPRNYKGSPNFWIYLAANFVTYQVAFKLPKVAFAF